MTETQPGSLEEIQKLLNAELSKAMDSQRPDLIAKLTAEIKSAIDARFAEAQAAQAKFALPGAGEEKHKGQKFSFSKFMAAVATKNWSNAGLEKEMSDAFREKTRTMGVSPDSAGGYAVPTEVVVDQIIPLLYANSVCVELGATTLNGLTAIPTLIPRVSGGTTAYWLSEGGTITASDLTLQQVRLAPKGLAALTAVSHLLNNVGNPAIENMIKMDQARQLALKLDLAAMAGTGASGQPIGILNASGVNTITLADPGTYDEFVSMIAAVRADNALSGKLGWALSNADMLEIEQIKDVTGGTDNKSNIQPLQRRTLLNAAGTEMLGYPVKVSTQLSDGQVIFGNWADLILAQWGGLFVDTTNAVGFTTGAEHLRSIMYVDIGVRHAESFCIDD